MTIKCARCGTDDPEANVYQRVNRDGTRWPPLCVHCATKTDRIRAVNKSVGAAA